MGVVDVRNESQYFDRKDWTLIELTMVHHPTLPQGGFFFSRQKNEVNCVG